MLFISRTYSLWVWTGIKCSLSNQKCLLYERWRRSWLQNNNQRVKKVLHRLQEPQWSSKTMDSDTVFQQNRQVSFGEYQASSASRSPVYFVTFIILAKAIHYQNIAKLLTPPNNMIRVLTLVCHKVWQIREFKSGSSLWQVDWLIDWF